jgi:DNA-binding NtrC family response regulator
MTVADTPESTVLLVEDDRSNLESLERLFAREGYRVLTSSDAKTALDVMRKHRVHVVVTDLMMPGLSGMDLLKAIKTVTPETEVVMMTAYGTVETAVEAMRAGAYDFVEKPLKRLQITKSVAKAMEKSSLIAENKTLREEISQLKKREIIGSSPALRQVLEVAAQAAPSSATVLVLGESGAGKELLARYIHTRSSRAQGPFIGVNCAAIPETILEAELFGYEKGAFTGATQRREGRFAQARGGTLFLDEVGELTPAVQVKLLRVLQEGEFDPLGGRTTRADVRIIAATNRDLLQSVRDGRFREDLYYRLNVIAVTCPPLRARQGDVPLLVEHFVQVYGRRNNKGPFALTQAALEKLSDYSWPGNVRELENTIERAVVLAKSLLLDVADLPRQIAEHERIRSEIVVPLGTPLEEIERRVIRETLRATGGDKKQTATLLKIATRTIYRKLAEENKAAGLPPDPPDGDDEGDADVAADSLS